MDSPDAAGRSALVTGANRGLGLEACVQLHELGFRVILTSRRKEEGVEAARGIDSNGTAVAYHPLDITDGESIASLVSDLPGLAPRVDLLVNNAGVGSWGADLEKSKRTIAVNYLGSRDVTDAVLPFLPKGGRVVMVSSGLGELSTLGPQLRSRFADPGLTRSGLDALVDSYLSDLESGDRKSAGWPSAYSVSKVALNALTKILARDLDARGVAVNSVCPG